MRRMTLRGGDRLRGGGGGGSLRFTTTTYCRGALLNLLPPLLLDPTLISFSMSSSAAFMPTATTDARIAVLNISIFLIITHVNQAFFKYMIEPTTFSYNRSTSCDIIILDKSASFENCHDRRVNAYPQNFESKNC